METHQNTNFPQYLNEIFFTKCLKTCYKANIQIRNLQITLGTNPGENYTSFIYRVNLEWTENEGKTYKSLDLIVKSMPTDGDRAFLQDINLHIKEKDAYFIFLPRVHELLVNCRVAPRCLYASSDPIQTIVFDNLKSQGYALADRVVGLDEDHVQLVLEKLAKLHAAGIHILQANASLYENFKEGFFCKSSINTEVFQIFFRKNLKKAAEMVIDMPGFEHFAPKLISIYENFPTIALQCITPKTENIKTINHGDVWVNNIMFKYDDHIPKDALFVDFQASYVNSPAFDLNYFFITSARLPILQRKEEFIQKYYYPVFESTLRTIKCPIPSYEKLIHEIQQHELFSFFNLYGALPLISMEREESKTNDYTIFTNEATASNKREVGMSSRRFIDTMQYALQYFEQFNIFEIKLDPLNEIN